MLEPQSKWQGPNKCFCLPPTLLLAAGAVSKWKSSWLHAQSPGFDHQHAKINKWKTNKITSSSPFPWIWRTLGSGGPWGWASLPLHQITHGETEAFWRTATGPRLSGRVVELGLEFWYRALFHSSYQALGTIMPHSLSLLNPTVCGHTWSHTNQDIKYPFT